MEAGCDDTRSDASIEDPPMIRLTALGAPHLADADAAGSGRAIALAGQQPKRLALLAYLAVARPRGEQRRDTLLALLWPELDQARARSALRQALHGVRAALGAAVIDSRGMNAVAVSPGALACDVWELEEAAARGEHARVLALHQGELLAGLFVSDAPAFEQWLDAERARLRALAVAAAWALADGGDDATRWARRAVALSPCDEGAVRRAMRLLAARGDRAGALAAYEQFAAALRAELAAEPSAETEQLAHSLRHSSFPPKRESRREPVPVPILDPRFRGDDVRETDDERTTAPPRPAARTRAPLAAGLALAAAILVGVARHAPTEPPPRDPRRVAVADFVEESGRPPADPVGRIAAAELRAGLGGLGVVEVLAAPEPLAGEAVPASPRAGTAVRGVVRRDADSLQYRAEVVDVAAGTVVQTVDSRWAPAAAPARALASLRDGVQAAVGTALYPGWSGAIGRPTSYAAYRAFVDGMERIRREEHDSAAAAFDRAFAADSGFTVAALLAASEHRQLRRRERAESLVARVAARRDSLAPLDRRLLEWMTATLGDDQLGAVAAMREVVALAPHAELARLQLAIDALHAARPSEAAAALRAIDADGDFPRGRASYWATWAETLHALGRHDRELAVVRDGLARHPQLRVLVDYELRALAALGRVDELRRRADALLALPHPDGVTPGETVRRVAGELRAHGDSAAARALLARLLAWYAAHPAPHADLTARAARARALYVAGDLAAARAAYDSLLSELPRCLGCVGALGLVAARAGDRAAALRHDAALAASPSRPMHGTPAYWRARIAAALGDRARAAALLTAAFADGTELEALAHVDLDLGPLDPAAVYRQYAGGGR
jgi:serine/threonine-protein kinase